MSKVENKTKTLTNIAAAFAMQHILPFILVPFLTMLYPCRHYDPTLNPDKSLIECSKKYFGRFMLLFGLLIVYWILLFVYIAFVFKWFDTGYGGLTWLLVLSVGVFEFILINTYAATLVHKSSRSIQHQQHKATSYLMLVHGITLVVWFIILLIMHVTNSLPEHWKHMEKPKIVPPQQETDDASHEEIVSSQ